MNKKPTAAEVTADIISSWKSQYGKVVRYKADDGKTAYFKSPDIATMDAAAALAKTNPVKSNVLVAKACFIGGDEEVVTEDKYIFGLGNHLQALIQRVEGELSEL